MKLLKFQREFIKAVEDPRYDTKSGKQFLHQRQEFGVGSGLRLAVVN